MPRVSEETIIKLQDFLDSLPEHARNKCALCNESLTHLVKTAEAQTGVGTATVTRELANRINEDAAPGDRVSGKQLEDRARYHSGSDKIGNSDNKPDNEEERSTPAIETMASNDTPEPQQTDQTIETATIPHNHRAQGTGENEWYTPQEYIDEVRNVLGDIDLDPATSETANQKIQAKTTYTKQDDGLSMKWFGRVWLNPPYSQPAISDFSKKMVNEWNAGRVTSAIVLTHNYTDTRWFQLFASACAAICFTRGRIAFINQYGEKAAPTQGQAFFYFGSDLPVFTETFKKFGFVVEVK